MGDLVRLLWWLLLYPVSAAIALVVAYAAQWVASFAIGLPSISRLPYVSLLVVVLPCYLAAGAFVHLSGALAPAAKLRAAGAACGITLLVALVAWPHLPIPAFWPVAGPLALGALIGLLEVRGDQRRAARERGAIPSPGEEAESRTSAALAASRRPQHGCAALSGAVPGEDGGQ